MLAKERRIADLPILMLEGKEERERERERGDSRCERERKMFICGAAAKHTHMLCYLLGS